MYLKEQCALVCIIVLSSVLHIDAQSGKLDVQSEKPDAQSEKLDAQSEKLDVQSAKLGVQSAKLDVQSEKLDVESAKLGVQSAKLDVQTAKLDAQSGQAAYSIAIDDDCTKNTCVRKCCPNGMLWSEMEPFGCVPAHEHEPAFVIQFIDEFFEPSEPDGPVQLIYGNPPCYSGIGPSQGFVLPNGSFFSFRSQSVYNYDQYCMELIRFPDGVVRMEPLTCICKEKSTCIPKCCSGDKILYKTAKHYGCTAPLEQEPTFNVTFHTIFGTVVEPDHPVHRVIGIPPCKSGLRGDNGLILTDGRLYSTIDNFYFEPQQYCLEVTRLQVGSHENDTKATLQPFSCPPVAVVYLHHTYIGFAFMSLVALLFLIVCHLAIPQLRDIPGKCLLCYALSLELFYLMFVMKPLWVGETPYGTCVILGIAQPAAAISSFLWLSVMCYDVWRYLTFSSRCITASHLRVGEDKRFLLYSIIVWGITLTYVCVTTTLQQLPSDMVPSYIIRPDIGVNGCYIKFDSLTKFVYVSCVLLIASVLNTVLISKTIYIIYQNGVAICGFTKKIPKTEESYKFQLTNHLATFWQRFQLFVLMTVIWPLVSVSPHIPPWQLWVLPFMANALQGVIVLFIFLRSPPKRKLVAALWKRCFAPVQESIRRVLSKPRIVPVSSDITSNTDSSTANNTDSSTTNITSFTSCNSKTDASFNNTAIEVDSTNF